MFRLSLRFVVQLGFVLFLVLGISVVGRFFASAASAAPHAAALPLDTPSPTATSNPNCAAGWTRISSPNIAGVDNILRAVTVISPNNIWAVGSAGNQTLTEHWDGSQWTVVSSPSPGTSSNSLNGVAAAASDDIWAVGTYSSGARLLTLILHWDGAQWAVVPSPNPASGDSQFNGVAALSANTAWAVGVQQFGLPSGQTLIEHWDGLSWQIVPSPNLGTGRDYLAAVIALAPDNAWTTGSYYVGSNQYTLSEHWNGTDWQIVSSPNPAPTTGGNSLLGIAAISALDIWAVGHYNTGDLPDRTMVEHWDGAQWGIIPSPNNPDPSHLYNELDSVVALSTQEIWVVGSSRPNWLVQDRLPLILQWDGTSWQTMRGANLPASTDAYFLSLAGHSTTDLWAVGSTNDGRGYQTLIEHYASPCSTPTVTSTPTPSPTALMPSGTPLPTYTPNPTNTSYPTSTPYPSSTPYPPTPCSIRFSDVHETDYFYTPVLYLACHSVIAGYADSTFRPYNSTTRSQEVKIIVLGFGIPLYTPPAGSATFADIPPSHPFFVYIETAAHNRIVSGYNCGDPGEPCDSQQRPYFRPYAAVTRGQLAKITVVGAGWTPLNPTTASFADVTPDMAFYQYVEAAYCHGIINGYSCGGSGEPCDSQQRPYFRQNNNATRGQIAKLSYIAITSSSTCIVPQVVK